MDIRELATLENAKEYEATNEKFIYCLDLMGVSIEATRAELFVNKLEDMFDLLLAEKHYGH